MHGPYSHPDRPSEGCPKWPECVGPNVVCNTCGSDAYLSGKCACCRIYMAPALNNWTPRWRLGADAGVCESCKQFTPVKFLCEYCYSSNVRPATDDEIILGAPTTKIVGSGTSKDPQLVVYDTDQHSLQVGICSESESLHVEESICKGWKSLGNRKVPAGTAKTLKEKELKVQETELGRYLSDLDLDLTQAAYLELFIQECKEEEDLTRRKNSDYTGSNDALGNFKTAVFLSNGYFSIDHTILIRMSDKIKRIFNLGLGKEALVKDEALTDTLRDMSVYCKIFRIVLEQKKRVASKTPANGESFRSSQCQVDSIRIREAVESD